MATRPGLPRFLKDPRGRAAASSFPPFVWLSYVLPGARGDRPDARAVPPALPEAAPIGGDVVVTPSRRISLLPALAAFARRWVAWRWPFEVVRGSTVVGWGYRLSGRRALRLGKRKAARAILLEDGFLRSVGRHDPAIGLNIDEGAIYYDASGGSRLFALIRRPLSPAQADRAQALARFWRRARLSKYNASRAYGGSLPDRFVLVIDQVRNDLSIRHGLADARSFDAMLDEALAADPAMPVVVKLHPDSASDPSKSHFDRARLEADPRVHLIADTSHVADLVARAEAVYAVTSQVGFEALLHGKPVHVFGMPFYAGWGLTRDRLKRPDGRVDVALEQLVHAALVDYPRYFNPAAQREVEVEDAAALVALNRQLRDAFPPTVYALGFSPWKRGFVRDFLAGSELRFVERFDQIPEGATVLVWGSRALPPDRGDLEPLRIEDGFLRSSGLGADLTVPLSLVIDDIGIYYDATRPSRLEALLVQRDYTDEERARAAALREAIAARRLTKYNLGGQRWTRPEGREVLLAVGQVEDDASIAFGSPETRSNVALLRRVRAEYPDAYIVYKPHPDVVAGLRARDGEADEIARLCDEILPHADALDLIDKVDAVHTMTSLLGFEALMRGKRVTCYGLPFYAGWGLTTDRLHCERRARRRTLDELVHAALIDYPRYYSRRAGLFVPPEDILVELADLAAEGPAGQSGLRKWMRPLLGWWKTRRVGR